MQIPQSPTVTIAIPTLNEAKYIQSVIYAFLEQRSPHLLEIIVADGGSTDDTQSLVHQLASEHSEVKLLHNPHKIQSYALNLILQRAQGDIFLRADAHAIYADNYIQKCITALRETEAVNVGGAQRFVAKSAFQSGVAIASRSPFGNGKAKYRDPNYSGYAETVYLGCFWRKALESVGGYCVDAVTNQDAELNLRLLADNPQAIYVSSDIEVWYAPRQSLKSLAIQYFRYGRGRFLTTTKFARQSPWRTKLPSLLFGILLIVVVILTIRFTLAVALLPVVAILGALLIESVRVTSQSRGPFEKEIWHGDTSSLPSLPRRILDCWLALSMMPLAYVLGNSYQFCRYTMLRKRGW